MKVIQFSGGIDSLALLVMMNAGHQAATVLTVLTDGAYPEMGAYLTKVSDTLPGFHYVVHHTERHLAEFGQPVDIVPLRWTGMGQLARGSHDVRYQDAFSCCHRAIWEPLDRISRQLGATEIYRGQRDEDRLRSPLKNGDIDRGVKMCFPLHDWSRREVFDYVMERAPSLMPQHYVIGERTSRDCQDCTAYLEDNHARIEHLPDLEKQRVNALLTRWHRDVITEMENTK